MTNALHFRFLAAGKFISDIGTYLDMVALNVYVYQVTASAFYTGLFMAVRLFGGFLTSFYAGVLCDGANRKALMIAADIARGLAVLSLVLIPAPIPLGLFFFVAFVLGSFGSLFEVALQSSVPAIVGPENRVKGNAVLGACQSTGMVIGCTAGGTLLGMFGYKAAFGIDSVTYLLSALNLFLLPLRTVEARHSIPPKAPFFSEVRAIFRYLQGIPVVLGMLVIRLADALGSASHNVGLPILAARLDPAHPSYYVGVGYATWASGKLLCSWAASRNTSAFARRMRESGFSERAFGLSTLTMSAAFICLFWSDSFIPIAFFSVIAGIADGLSEISYQSRLQEVPDEIRGRAFGVASTMQTVGFGIGMVACAPLFAWFSPGGVVSVLHGLPMVMAAVFTAAVFYGLKQKFMRAEIPLPVLVAFSIGAWASFSPSAYPGTKPGAAKDYVIAQIDSLTGPEATYGTSVDRGAPFAVEDINGPGRSERKQNPSRLHR